MKQYKKKLKHKPIFPNNITRKEKQIFQDNLKKYRKLHQQILKNGTAETEEQIIKRVEKEMKK